MLSRTLGLGLAFVADRKKHPVRRRHCVFPNIYYTPHSDQIHARWSDLFDGKIVRNPRTNRQASENAKELPRIIDYLGYASGKLANSASFEDSKFTYVPLMTS